MGRGQGRKRLNKNHTQNITWRCILALQLRLIFYWVNMNKVKNFLNDEK